MPSLVEAIEHKYGGGGGCCHGSEDEDSSVAIFVPSRPPRACIPSLLVLNDCGITTAGEEEALIAKCATVEELDLAKNQLNEWEEIMGILKQMPRLKFVNLSFNHLSTPLEYPVIDKDLCWQHLYNLVLNSTHINWESVQQLLDCLPNLEELHLSLNDYDHVNLCDSSNHQTAAAGCSCRCNNDNEADADAAAKENETNAGIVNCSDKRCACLGQQKRHKHLGLRKLHFNGNLVSKWREICKLGYAFPNLDSLVLAHCPITGLDLDDCEDAAAASSEAGQANGKISYERSESECESSGRTMESPHDSFRKLKILNMNSTDIGTWDDIERLAKFPSLNCLRLQGCKLWDSHEYTEHERRQMLIARLPNVEMLNGGGIIDAEEREDAERAFIRYFMEKPESDRPERYFELLGRYGKLDPLVNVDLRPEKRVKVLFTFGNNSEIKSVDVYRTVADLKTKLEPFAGISANKMRLFYVDQDLRDHMGPEEMKYPSKQLYSYNIRSGDEIIVDYKIKPKAVDK